jgi:hypothetical protein
MNKQSLSLPLGILSAPTVQALLTCLALMAILISGCKNTDPDEEPTPEPEPPILLCEELGLGNLDATKAGGNTFTFVNNPNAPVDYVIDCFPRVLVDATIEPGTVIEFGENGGLYVTGDGSLSAVGTAGDTIIMRGTNATQGWWRGVAFGADDPRNALSYVVIDGAGGTATIQGGFNTALFDNTSNLKVTHTTISRSNDYGFVKSGLKDFGAFSNNTFTDNNGFPVWVHANLLGQLDGSGSRYQGNGNNMIKMAISGGSVITVVSDQTWKNPGVPVRMDEGTLGVRAALTVEAGFELVLQPDCNLVINDEGSFNAVGTASAPIIIRGEQDLQGYWESMYMEGTSVLNRLDYVTITNGGRIKPFGAAAEKANLYLANGLANLTISNSTFSQSLGCGIYQGTAAVTLRDNTYENNAGGDVCP